MLMWYNKTGITNININNYLGFIYRIDLEEGFFYIGRKQYWRPVRRKGKPLQWVETDWKEYTSSSKYLDPEKITQKSILAVFTSKSLLRYAEAYAIINTGAYEHPLGLNWSFDSCKGTLKFEDTDGEQLERLKDLCKIEY